MREYRIFLLRHDLRLSYSLYESSAATAALATRRGFLTPPRHLQEGGTVKRPDRISRQSRADSTRSTTRGHAPQDLKVLRARLDETIKVRDLLATDFRRSEANYETVNEQCSHERLQGAYDNWEKTGSPYPYSERDLRVADVDRHNADLWYRNGALEDGLIETNAAARLGRFVKSEKPAHQAAAMTREEAETFLASVAAICPERYPFFLTALRAGLRRGELIALKWGDIQFGADENDSNRFILIQRNYVCGRFTTPKSKKSRRVDLSRQLRATLLELRDDCLPRAMMAGKTSIADDLVTRRSWAR